MVAKAWGSESGWRSSSARSGLDPRVQRGCECDIAEVAQARAHTLDVVGEAEDLLDHDDPGAGAGIGYHQVAGELVPVAGADALLTNLRHARSIHRGRTEAC